MHFQIFIPDVRGSDPAHLAAVGLVDLCEGANWLESTGPKGQRGMLVAWPTPTNPQIGFDEELQTWHPAIALSPEEPAARYWIGFRDGQPPMPKDLQRRYPYAGRHCELGDGHPWLIPEPHELPADAIRADDGGWKFEVQRRFHAHYLECEAWCERLAQGRDNYFDALDFVERALRLNYRYVTELNQELRLFTRSNIGPALLVACGAQAIHDQRDQFEVEA